MLKFIEPSIRNYKKYIYQFASPLLSPIYRGLGSILMLHRITEGVAGPRIGGCESLLETSLSVLKKVIYYLRQEGYTFISLDELSDIVRSQRKATKFVAITFDDGFRDNYTRAFPALTSMNIPFAVYVTVGFPEKKSIPWEYLLEKHVLSKDELLFDFHEDNFRFPLFDMAQKETAYAKIASLFEEGALEERSELAAILFGEEAVSQLSEELFITWEELREMSDNPLVTIGAHTVSHPKLRSLKADDARYEISACKGMIEDRLGVEVRHLAYPYGTPNHVGKREFEMAEDCGYITATTTRLGNIFKEHVSGLHCLPRVYGSNFQEMKLALSGIVSAFRYRGRKVIME